MICSNNNNNLMICSNNNNLMICSNKNNLMICSNQRNLLLTIWSNERNSILQFTFLYSQQKDKLIIPTVPKNT